MVMVWKCTSSSESHALVDQLPVLGCLRLGLAEVGFRMWGMHRAGLEGMDKLLRRISESLFLLRIAPSVCHTRYSSRIMHLNTSQPEREHGILICVCVQSLHKIV